MSDKMTVWLDQEADWQGYAIAALLTVIGILLGIIIA